ncbi:MAG: Long-chain-fatty-acid--CoA ligase FadD15 [Gammaproteobacteria bacterium]|nr:Long-chain-fatty-acid--CoA ligase FadD15 [Gammaproteobacteria bacterium]
MREKDFGIWQTWTWSEMLDEIRVLACGLAARGFQRGDTLAIVGDNRPRLYWGIAAAQCLGGVPVPAYQDAAAEELQFVLEHCEAKFVLAEDQEQVDKVLEIQDRCPALKEIVYDEHRGMRNYDHARMHDFETIQAQGRKFHEKQPEFFDRQIATGKGSDTSIILYTSGTTGRPKGVVLSYDNMVITARCGVEFDKLTEKEEILAYLPMAWVGDHLFSYAQAYIAGFCVSCPEGPATVMHDMNEIGPTFFFAPPTIFENLLTQVSIRMEDAARIKQAMFHYFMGVAQKVGPKILRGARVGLLDRIGYFLGNVLVYGPLKNTMGMSRIRLAYTAGEAIGPDIFDFYRSLGINIKQLYGQTEAAVNITLQPDGEVYPDTVGKPAPEVEIKISDSGEVLYRSPGVFQCYHKNEEATREVKTEDGWVRTGDAGFFDTNEHLKIIDRVKDVGGLNDGSMFAPKYIENKLKFFPHIKEAVAFGHERDYCTAMINIDLEAVGNWAERRNIPYSSYQELASRPEVYELVQEGVEKVNADLAEDEKLAPSRIKRFLLLHKELDADDGELTRTRKVRRGFIADKYQEIIDALYGGESSCHVETQVTYEDGRTGKLSGNLEIRDLSFASEKTRLKKAS